MSKIALTGCGVRREYAEGKKTDAINTFLGSGTSVDGTIEFNGTIRLDGNVKGEIFRLRSFQLKREL